MRKLILFLVVFLLLGCNKKSGENYIVYDPALLIGQWVDIIYDPPKDSIEFVNDTLITLKTTSYSEWKTYPYNVNGKFLIFYFPEVNDSSWYNFKIDKKEDMLMIQGLHYTYPVDPDTTWYQRAEW